MKNLKIALVDFNPESYSEAWEATYQWGHQVELNITEQQQLKPSVEAVKLGKAIVDIFVCNRTHIDDGLDRATRRLTGKPVIRYEVTQFRFYGIWVSPLYGIDDMFDELSQLSSLD